MARQGLPTYDISLLPSSTSRANLESSRTDHESSRRHGRRSGETERRGRRRGRQLPGGVPVQADAPGARGVLPPPQAAGQADRAQRRRHRGGRVRVPPGDTHQYQKRGADDNWYFLSPRSRRYPGGDRPTRRTADNRGRLKPGRKKGAADHSKASKGRPRKNLSVGAIEFTENTLAYYVGEPRNENETKTKWLMHELTVPELDKEKGPENAAVEQVRHV